MYKEIIERAKAAAERANAPSPGDYYDGGLLYCGKCKTPKQTRVELFGAMETVGCMCRCDSDRQRLEDENRRQRERDARIIALRGESFPDKAMTGWTFDADDGTNVKVSTAARKYAERFDYFRERGTGLLLYGSVGSGKTFIASCIANALIDKGIPCLVTNFSRINNAMSGIYSGKQEYLDDLHRYELLVLDDLAAERDTPYMLETVHNVIDARYRAKLPLIVTTNLTPEELKHPADLRHQRIYSRLFEMCHPLEISGNDRRKQKLRESFKETSEVLGL